MANLGFIDRALASFDQCPWSTFAGTSGHYASFPATTPAATPISSNVRPPIYSSEERRRRDASPWTLVQGVLAPFQFLVFAVSLWLIVWYLATGEGAELATASIIAKTLVLYTIMITGSIWEREVFGKYLFAPAFFWEDVVSMLVIGLHTAYLYAVVTSALGIREQMLLALLAYASYVVNAGQFLVKLRSARREAERMTSLPRRPQGRAT
ncbi:3-vinyl bacteriochlorophyllide hydratase [Dongia mobilis]|uniref:3-vinyl bacteriochlorophyllide hydratase n=1 Tax=Dongia mobilis TaxID=578943 RepID=A0A4V6PXJ2_9PROT|nr:2-vinyl bacteriochlorophyllide hydratase [Dongia mobilis]TDQ82950.1 3-vinyl bacteriochlorophyllide hydratase [Dongia mobilis]